MAIRAVSYSGGGGSKNNSSTSTDNSVLKAAKSQTGTSGMDDNGTSNIIRNRNYSTNDYKNINSTFYKPLLHANNIFERNEIDLFNKTYRFGVFNPYGALTTTREYLFFTKPDLNIYYRDDSTGSLTKGKVLNDALQGYPFWVDLANNHPKVLELLQASANTKDNFNHLLQNQVISSLEIPGLSAESIESPNNMYGVSINYRGSSESSDDNLDFSLEFRDTKWLDTYYFFKAYEEYETLKHHGVIRPFKKYIEDRVIHDQFSVYKFLVDEDMETIIYYGKYYGVMPMSLPRDVFSEGKFDNGISYSISFKAAFFEDMRPDILADFNNLSKSYYDAQTRRIDVYNDVLGMIDNRPAKAAYIEKVSSSISPTGFLYKLRWRGSDNV